MKSQKFAKDVLTCPSKTKCFPPRVSLPPDDEWFLTNLVPGSVFIPQTQHYFPQSIRFLGQDGGLSSPMRLKSIRHFVPLFRTSLLWSFRTSTNTMATLETLNFDNLALHSLPIDKETQNVIRQVKDACFTLVKPTKVNNPTLVAYSQEALSLLDLPPSEVTRPDFVQYMSGDKILPGSQTAAHCYCGHQQGYFSGQLGDGAAM